MRQLNEWHRHEHTLEIQRLVSSSKVGSSWEVFDPDKIVSSAVGATEKALEIMCCISKHAVFSGVGALCCRST